MYTHPILYLILDRGDTGDIQSFILMCQPSSSTSTSTHMLGEVPPGFPRWLTAVRRILCVFSLLAARTFTLQPDLWLVVASSELGLPPLHHSPRNMRPSQQLSLGICSGCALSCRGPVHLVPAVCTQLLIALVVCGPAHRQPLPLLLARYRWLQLDDSHMKLEAKPRADSVGLYKSTLQSHCFTVS